MRKRWAVLGIAVVILGMGMGMGGELGLVKGETKGEVSTTAPWQRNALVGHVVIISVDGMRPDLMLRGKTPVLHKLLEESTFTMWGKTIDQAITLPSHVSMLTGVTAERHGVMWNGDLPEDKQEYPKVPTIFDVAKENGLTTALATGKTKFHALMRGKVVDWSHLAANNGNDEEVAKAAGEIVKDHKPNVMFVHLGGTDGAGHAYGWSSQQQMEALAKADKAVGVVLDAYKAAGLADKTLVIVSADHGGQGTGHGPNDTRSLHIPWIVRGPGIKKGYDLTINALVNVKTEDTFATACYLLGLPVARDLDGKPVLQILDSQELMVTK